MPVYSRIGGIEIYLIGTLFAMFGALLIFLGLLDIFGVLKMGKTRSRVNVSRGVNKVHVYGRPGFVLLVLGVGAGMFAVVLIYLGL